MDREQSYRTMTGHPDVAEMGERFEAISGSPSAVITDALLVVAGLWLAISAWVVHFHDSVPNVVVSNLVIGLAVAVMGMGQAMRPRTMVPLGWATFLAGVWIIVSPWVIQQSTIGLGLLLTNVITGGVIALLGLVGAGMSVAVKRRAAHGRW
jgi:hypothetical protein